MEKEEIWRPIRGFDGVYEASNLGRIRSLDREIEVRRSHTSKKRVAGTIIRPSSMMNGYSSFALCIGGLKERQRTHRAVCEAFHGAAPSPRHVVRHLNGDRGDNRSDNLAWGTRLENYEDQIRHGTTTRGEQSGTAKLRAEDVLALRRNRDEGVPVAVLAKKFGISAANVSMIATSKRWAHLASGDGR